jgi:copper(I)-binding protein
MKWLALFAAALLSAVLPAWAGEMEVSEGFLRAPPKAAASGAGFLSIRNGTGQDDRLIAVEAGVSRLVELHTHVRDGDMMRMRRVEAIAIPAGAAIELKPGGDHIMFIGLTQVLQEGQTVPVRLVFEKAGRKAVDLPVLGVGAMKP